MHLDTNVLQNVDSGTFEFKAGTLELICLGFCLINQSSFAGLWSEGFSSGFWVFFASYIFSALGFLCFLLCFAEITSTLPFSGGSYGFVRITLGPYLGFIVGCCEAIQNFIYLILGIAVIGQIITQIFETTPFMQVLYWFLFFITAIPFQHSNIKHDNSISHNRKRLFWMIIVFMGSVTTVSILIYIFSVIPKVNFERYAVKEYSNDSDGSVVFKFMQSLNKTVFFYIGLELIALAGGDSKDPQKNVPHGMLGSIIILFPIITVEIFMAASASPGISVLATQLYTLSFGFSQGLNISTRQALWFSLLPSYATAYAFLFGFHRQITAMSESGLLLPWPKLFDCQFSKLSSYLLLINTAVFAFLVVLILGSFSLDAFSCLAYVALLAGIVVYACILVSFLFFRGKYGNLRRKFVNNFGVYSAYCGLFIFAIVFISVGYTAFSYIPYLSLSVLLGLLSLYYFLYAKDKQTFSAHEQDVMFRVFVINSNLDRQQRRHLSSKNSTSNCCLDCSQIHCSGSFSLRRRWLKYLMVPRILPSEEGLESDSEIDQVLQDYEHHIVNESTQSMWDDGANIQDFLQKVSQRMAPVSRRQLQSAEASTELLMGEKP